MIYDRVGVNGTTHGLVSDGDQAQNQMSRFAQLQALASAGGHASTLDDWANKDIGGPLSPFVKRDAERQAGQDAVYRNNELVSARHQREAYDKTTPAGQQAERDATLFREGQGLRGLQGDTARARERAMQAIQNEAQQRFGEKIGGDFTSLPAVNGQVLRTPEPELHALQRSLGEGAYAGNGGGGNATGGGSTEDWAREMEILKSAFSDQPTDFAKQDALRSETKDASEKRQLENQALKAKIAEEEKARADAEASRLNQGNPAAADAYAKEHGTTVVRDPIEEYVGKNGGMFKDLGDLSKSFYDRDITDFGGDPGDEDIDKIMGERDRLVDIMVGKGYPEEKALREANRTIETQIGSEGGDWEAEWTQKLKDRMRQTRKSKEAARDARMNSPEMGL